MTGTAMTEAAEFGDIYKLEVIEIPTNVPVQPQRQRRRGLSHRRARNSTRSSSRSRNAASASSRCWSAPSAIEKSEALSALLKKQKIPHNVLNARYHEQEAYIIAQAGRPGAVTIATNMAGRGTDIQLGGNLEMRAQAPGAGRRSSDPAERDARAPSDPRRDRGRRARSCAQAGGLYVIGTERHESRRIDNQLRGRSGRQGDPGASKFFLSLEDDLMRIFGSERMDVDAAAPRPQGGRGDHPSLDQQGAGEGAAEGRGAQLRHPQEAAEIRRRDERPAQGHLRAAPRDHERARRRRDRRRHAPRGDRRHGRARDPGECAMPSSGTSPGCTPRCLRLLALDLPVADWAKEEGIADDEIEERIDRRRRPQDGREGPPITAPS